MRKKHVPVKSPEDIPEVLAFMDAQSALQEFKEYHKDLFRELEGLVDCYNSTLEQADKVVRQHGAKCGPFDGYQVSVKYDAAALFNAVGRDTFLKLGGIIHDKVAFDLDKGQFEAAMASPNNKISDEVLALVRKESVNYHVPPKLALP
jgi:hypothetical protein